MVHRVCLAAIRGSMTRARDDLFMCSILRRWIVTVRIGCASCGWNTPSLHARNTSQDVRSAMILL
eukprot:293288-Alexandrium_andersonii.AAC.1